MLSRRSRRGKKTRKKRGAERRTREGENGVMVHEEGNVTEESEVMWRWMRTQ